MNMMGDAAGDVAVAYAIRQNDAGDVVAAGENGGKVTAGIGAGGYGDDVGLKTCEFELAMGFFVSGPELHAAEGAHFGGAAFRGGGGIEFLEFHGESDASTAFAEFIPRPRSLI